MGWEKRRGFVTGAVKLANRETQAFPQKLGAVSHARNVSVSGSEQRHSPVLHNPGNVMGDPSHQCTICSFPARISNCFVIYIKKKKISEDPNDGDSSLLRADVSSGGF